MIDVPAWPFGESRDNEGRGQKTFLLRLADWAEPSQGLVTVPVKNLAGSCAMDEARTLDRLEALEERGYLRVWRCGGEVKR